MQRTWSGGRFSSQAAQANRNCSADGADPNREQRNSEAQIAFHLMKNVIAPMQSEEEARAARTRWRAIAGDSRGAERESAVRRWTAIYVAIVTPTHKPRLRGLFDIIVKASEQKWLNEF